MCVVQLSTGRYPVFLKGPKATRDVAILARFALDRTDFPEDMRVAFGPIVESQVRTALRAIAWILASPGLKPPYSAEAPRIAPPTWTDRLTTADLYELIRAWKDTRPPELRNIDASDTAALAAAARVLRQLGLLPTRDVQ